VRLSPAAKVLWVDFYNSWAQEQQAVEGEVAATYSKLEGCASRLALLHHLVTRVARGEDDCDSIGEDGMEAGIALVRWFAY
jgi:hypothetical protein